MADNTDLDAGTGGDTIATDDITDGGVANGAKAQRVKPGFGADNNYKDSAIGNGSSGADVQRVTIADDSTGLIKLAAGTAAYGKLSANSGVDIGDVDVTSVIPGTGATNLGKAKDSVAGGTDTGVAVLAKHEADPKHLATADGDYDVLHLSELGALRVKPETEVHFDELDATTDWTVLGNDTINLATTKKHLTGTDALSFDKTDGLANTVYAGIQKTITSIDLGDVSLHDIMQMAFYVSSIANISYVFCRIGTDSTNYNEWRVEDTQLTAGEFQIAAVPVGGANNAGITGDGWDPSAITYIAVGVAFDAETNALSGIIFDQIGFFTNSHSAAILGSEVTSSVNTAKIDLQKVNGSVVDKGAGNVSNGSQRVVLASDQNFVKLEDAASSDGDAGIPAMARRTAAPADTSGADLDYEMLQIDNGRLWTSSTIDAALPAGTNGIGKLTANSGVDIGDVDILSIAAGNNNIGNVDIVTLPASTNTLEVVGDAAHDAAAVGNPVLTAGVAQDVDDTAPPNRVSTEADAVQLATDFDGALFVRTHGPQVWSYHVDGSSALTDAEVHADPGAGLSIYVTDIIVSSGAATAMNVFFEEATTKVLGPYYLEAVAGRGAVIRFSTPKKITANTALTVTTSAGIAHSIDVTGFIGQG